jgi:hypothetical protein
MKTEWTVLFHDDFKPEFDALSCDVQDALAEKAIVLRIQGPNLGRPFVDTLKGSKFANMKELRFDAAGGVWRFAFAFDPKRRAIIVCGGDKSGADGTRFYRNLINKADARFESHCAKARKE